MALRPIEVILKDSLPLDPPRHHMVQHTGGIESGATWQSAGLTIPPISLHRPLNSQIVKSFLHYPSVPVVFELT